MYNGNRVNKFTCSFRLDRQRYHSGVQHIQRQKDGSKEILHYSKRSNCNTKKTFIINYEYLSLEIFCLNNSRLNSSLLLFFR